MKKLVKYGILLGACAFTLSSCNCFKNMAKNTEQISVVANPEVLTLQGNHVVTDVTVTFPEKYYNPKAIVKITPMLVFEGGVIEGAPKYLQGEKVKDNYPVISKKSGGIYTQTISLPWDERARECTLQLKIEGKCKDGDEFQLAAVIPIARGVNTLQEEMSFAEVMAPMKDAYRRVTSISESVDIMYEVSKANVRKGELSKEQTKLFEDFIKEYKANDRATLGNIQAKGYASPEGPEGFNDKLSKKRGESAQAALSGEMKGIEGLKYDVASYGEDWDGFKKLVEASDMKDKNLILQVLNMYSSSAQRDSEIRNMSAVFNELKENILPQLRRAQMVATIDIEGKTNAELRAAVANDVNSLDLEEMLFAATLYDDNATKIAIYKAAAAKYNDARAYNNLGIAYSSEGDWAAAEKAFGKATELSSDPALNNNLAVVALAEGDLAKANKYLSGASKEAKAIAAIQSGDYATAASNLEGYNKAVAEVLNGNLTAAKTALGGDNSANADYLRGVIAAKEGNKDAAVANIKKAIEKAPELKAKALSDANLNGLVTAADL
jgi:tetratricopeptide (TPR) repeat protein